MTEQIDRPHGDRDEGGASAVEYALLVAAIAAVIVLVVFAIGVFTKALFTDTCDSMASGDFSMASTPTC